MDTPVETVKHIENNAVALSEKFNDQKTDFPTRTLPRGMEIHSLESEMRYRNQFRAIMKTQSINDFAEYFVKHEGRNCFIDDAQMRAKTIFDIGSVDKPEHCHHQAFLSLKKTSAFNQLISINSQRKSQRDMADWVEEWHDLIVPLEDTEEKTPISLSRAIAAIRRMTIEEIKKSDHDQGNFRSSRTAMESIEAKADEGMPGYFKFTCTPYEGLGERSFILRLSIIKSHDAPEFIMVVQRFDSIEEELAKEFKDLLVKTLPKACSTYIGTLST